MPEYKDTLGIREHIQMVLRGPDGEIKEERGIIFIEDDDNTYVIGKGTRRRI